MNQGIRVSLVPMNQGKGLPVEFRVKQTRPLDNQIVPDKTYQPEDPETKGPEQYKKNLPNDVQPSLHDDFFTLP
jgi:hypothetical protein